MQSTSTATICPYCGVGCGIIVHTTKGASGRVIGVVRMIYATGVNSIVPCHYVDSLIEDVSLDSRGNDSAALSIAVTPPGASLFLDGKLLQRSTGAMTTVPAGWHTLSCSKPGYEAWMGGQACYDTHSVAITLMPQKNLPIQVTKKKHQKATEASLSSYGKGELLLKEDFDSPERFEKWEQYTGGTDKRTWFLEKGTLNQFESNEVLHAIYLGDTAWTDYVVSARVRINNEQEDSRAGIIFRETPEGFYLFRIHRETDKAQIAYHCKQPFGWFVIMEKKLDTDIKDKWYAMTVAASGNNIACFLDAKCIFTAHAEYSHRGRIGFYSVESKTSFDSLEVSELPVNDEKTSPAYESGILSFWFSDYFTWKSGWWDQYLAENSAPAPWRFGDGGCALYGDTVKKHYSEFTKYLFDDFSLSMVLSIGKENDNSSFEIFFRKTDQGKTTLRFSKKEKKIRLLVKKGDREKTVKSISLPDDFFGNTSRLFLEINGSKVSLGTSENKLLEYGGKLFPTEHGRLGFAVAYVPAVLHEMTVSSVKQEK